MFLKNSLNSKENGSRRSIKARKSMNSALNFPLIDKENIGGLNDQLTGYIDYVRTIESTNEILKNEEDIVKKFMCYCPKPNKNGSFYLNGKHQAAILSIGIYLVESELKFKTSALDNNELNKLLYGVTIYSGFSFAEYDEQKSL